MNTAGFLPILVLLKSLLAKNLKNNAICISKIRNHPRLFEAHYYDCKDGVRHLVNDYSRRFCSTLDFELFIRAGI